MSGNKSIMHATNVLKPEDTFKRLCVYTVQRWTVKSYFISHTCLHAYYENTHGLQAVNTPKFKVRMLHWLMTFHLENKFRKKLKTRKSEKVGIPIFRNSRNSSVRYGSVSEIPIPNRISEFRRPLMEISEASANEIHWLVPLTSISSKLCLSLFDMDHKVKPDTL